MEFKLNPAYLRPETEPGYQKSSWRPTWKCFCCQDSGFVRLHLIKTVIDHYDDRTQKPVKCNASVCDHKFGEHLIDSGTLDTRFPSSICDRFDSEERNMWREWSMQQHEKRKSVVNLSDATNNLRARSRLPCEHFEAQRRHEDFRNK